MARYAYERLSALDALFLMLEDANAYLHVASGSVTVNGIELQAGDGATISAEPAVCISAAEAGEVLLFDLPAVK